MANSGGVEVCESAAVLHNWQGWSLSGRQEGIMKNDGLIYDWTDIKMTRVGSLTRKRSLHIASIMSCLCWFKGTIVAVRPGSAMFLSSPQAWVGKLDLFWNWGTWFCLLCPTLLFGSDIFCYSCIFFSQKYESLNGVKGEDCAAPLITARRVGVCQLTGLVLRPTMSMFTFTGCQWKSSDKPTVRHRPSQWQTHSVSDKLMNTVKHLEAEKTDISLWSWWSSRTWSAALKKIMLLHDLWSCN